MKVHFHMPIFWTACNRAARPNALGSKIKITKNKRLVTCGSCKNTQAFFSRDSDDLDVVHEKTVT